MPDVWTEAWAEAEASTTPEVDIFCTLELRHPSFVEGGSPFAVRAVQGTLEDQVLGIEDSSELNPGQMVTFKAIPFEAERPDFEEGRTPECKVKIDNIGEEIMPYLENATKFRADMEAIYREYRSDEMDSPCYGPVKFVIKSVKVIGARVEGIAQMRDLANLKFPNKVYTLKEYPGLLT